MTVVLFAVGLMATAAGLITIGFGIPINAFSLGNTLIISGTTAVVGGLIVIGLAFVHRQLKRIADGLTGKALPAFAHADEPAEIAEAQAPHVALAPVRAPVESLPEAAPVEPVYQAEPRVPEPRFPATAAEPAAGPLDWLRAKKPAAASAPPAVAETPMVDLTDEAPLSPRPPQRPAMPPHVEPGVESGTEPKNWTPTRDGGPFDFRPASRSEPPVPRAAPSIEPPKDKERFDLVWPDRGGAPAPAPAEPRADARAEPKREPAFDMPLPPVPARPRETRSAPEKRIPEVARRPAVERGPAILKSGVIDGMPYTLYADGSIEAQLPQGMVKFASVDALRAHLEKQS